MTFLEIHKKLQDRLRVFRQTPCAISRNDRTLAVYSCNFLSFGQTAAAHELDYTCSYDTCVSLRISITAGRRRYTSVSLSSISSESLRVHEQRVALLVKCCRSVLNLSRARLTRAPLRNDRLLHKTCRNRTLLYRATDLRYHFCRSVIGFACI